MTAPAVIAALAEMSAPSILGDRLVCEMGWVAAETVRAGVFTGAVAVLMAQMVDGRWARAVVSGFVGQSVRLDHAPSLGTAKRVEAAIATDDGSSRPGPARIWPA
jgi:hypothetical protein